MDSHVESIYLRELGDECEFALLAVQEMNRALKEPISLPASMTYDEPTIRTLSRNRSAANSMLI